MPLERRAVAYGLLSGAGGGPVMAMVIHINNLRVVTLQGAEGRDFQWLGKVRGVCSKFEHIDCELHELGSRDFTP